MAETSRATSRVRDRFRRVQVGSSAVETIPASSVEPQSLRLVDLLDSEPTTEASAASRVDFSSPRS